MNIPPNTQIHCTCTRNKFHKNFTNKGKDHNKMWPTRRKRRGNGGVKGGREGEKRSEERKEERREIKMKEREGKKERKFHTGKELISLLGKIVFSRGNHRGILLQFMFIIRFMCRIVSVRSHPWKFVGRG